MLKRSALLQLRWAVLLKYWHLYSERKKDRQNAIRGDKREREKKTERHWKRKHKRRNVIGGDKKKTKDRQYVTGGDRKRRK